MESKAGENFKHLIDLIEFDIKENTEKPSSKQTAETGNKMNLKRRVSLPVHIPVMANAFGNTNKEQKPNIIQWAKRDNPEIRHNLPFTPMPVRQTCLRIKNEAEKSSTMTHQSPVTKENKRQDVDIIQLTDNKMVQTDAPESLRIDDQDKELLKFYKINKIPPRQIISILKNSKYFNDANLNKEVSNVLEQKESQIKIASEKEPNKKVADQEEKEQGIVDKLLELSENNKQILFQKEQKESQIKILNDKESNKKVADQEEKKQGIEDKLLQLSETNKQILLKYFENEKNMANTEQVEDTPLTENIDSAINITKRKEHDDHLKRSILFELYQLFKRENNMASIGSKRNASVATSTSQSSPVQNLPQPPPKRATVSSKHTYLPHESQSVNMKTALPYNNIQQCPAPQYGYDLHQNDQGQMKTMATPQAVAPYSVHPRLPSHYQMTRFQGEAASVANRMQMYRKNMQPSANANQLYVPPQEPLQINQQNMQMEYQGYWSHENQQHILHEQAKQENWKRLQQLRDHRRRELEQQKLPAYYPNTQWSEYQRRV